MLPKTPTRLAILLTFAIFTTGCAMKDSGGGRAVDFNPLNYGSRSPIISRDTSSSTPDGVPLDCRTK